jgi:hypothetical protein
VCPEYLLLKAGTVLVAKARRLLVLFNKEDAFYGLVGCLLHYKSAAQTPMGSIRIFTEPKI